MAANVEIISEHTSFIELIEGGGAFVRDLWKRVVPKKPAGDMTRLDGWQYWRDDNTEAIPKVLISIRVRIPYWWLKRLSDWNSQLRLLAILSLKWGLVLFWLWPLVSKTITDFIEPRPWYLLKIHPPPCRMYTLLTICVSPVLISELCFRSQLCPRKWQEDSVILSL